MVFIFSEKIDLEVLATQIRELESDDRVDVICVYVSFNNLVSPHDFVSVMTRTKKKVMGAFYPGIIYQSCMYKNGYLLVGMNSSLGVQGHIIGKLSEKNISELEKDVKGLRLDESEVKTVFITADAFSSGVKNLIDAFFNIYSLNYNYIGGGAGAMDFKSRPCVFDNNDFYQDAALVVTLNRPSLIGTNHGLTPLDGPFLVTKSSGNIIFEIDYEPAFDFYKKVISKHQPQPVSELNFFDVAKNFPFGMPKLDSEAVIREAGKVVHSNAIECLGPIPENTSIFIMNGTQESLIKGTIVASLAADREDVSNYAFVLECASRAFMLGDEYAKALSLIRLRDELVFGAITIGEIANPRTTYLEYLNKTCVICRIVYDE